MFRTGKFLGTEISLVVAKGWGEGEIGSGYRVTFWGDENALELDSGDVCTTL